MKKLLILIPLFIFPMITFGQNDSNDTVKQNDIIAFETITIQKEINNQIAFDVYSKIDVNSLSYKKSNDLISIKAYRKSLQIKTKEVKSC